MNVALFITCLTDAFYPRAGIAVVKVLEHLGCRVEFPARQTCCGQPMFNTGLHADARDLARKMIADFAPYDYVVTPSGSCAAMVRDYYEWLFAGTPDGEPAARDEALREAAARLAAKTYEFVEFLVKVRKVDFQRLAPHWPGSATYHYSCHLRGLGLRDEAERVLRQVGGLDYRPLEKKEQCCGFGGTFALKFGAVSGELVRDKVACVRATGADALVCNDAGCGMNIEGACRRERVAVRMLSLAELLAEGLGLLPRDDQAGAQRREVDQPAAGPREDDQAAAQAREDAHAAAPPRGREGT